MYSSIPHLIKITYQIMPIPITFISNKCVWEEWMEDTQDWGTKETELMAPGLWEHQRYKSHEDRKKVVTQMEGLITCCCQLLPAILFCVPEAPRVRKYNINFLTCSKSSFFFILVMVSKHLVVIEDKLAAAANRYLTWAWRLGCSVFHLSIATWHVEPFYIPKISLLFLPILPSPMLNIHAQSSFLGRPGEVLTA